MTTSTPQFAERTLTPEELLNLTSVTDVLRYWNAGDIPGVLRYYRDDIIWRSIPLEQDYRGPHEVGAFIGALLHWLPDLHFEVTHKIACGSNVAERWRMRGTHRGTFIGVPATGKPVEVLGMSMLITREGRFVQDEFYFDAPRVLCQMRLLPPVTSFDSALGRLVLRGVVGASRTAAHIKRFVSAGPSDAATPDLDLYEQPPVDEGRLTDRERTNLRAVERSMQLRRAPEVVEMLRGCDDAIEWHDQSTGAAFVGKAAISDYLDRVFAGLPNGVFDPAHRIVHGDVVAQQWVLRGTHVGTLSGVPATGRQVALPGISMIELRDGHPLREALYYDHGLLLRQLGVMPPLSVGETPIGRAGMWLLVKRRQVAVVAAALLLLVVAAQRRA